MKKKYTFLILLSMLVLGNVIFAQTNENSVIKGNSTFQDGVKPKSLVKNQKSETITPNNAVFGPVTNKKNLTSQREREPKNLVKNQSAESTTKTNTLESSPKPASSMSSLHKVVKTKGQAQKKHQ